MSLPMSLLLKVWAIRLWIRSSGFFQSLVGAPPEYTKFPPDRSFTVKSTRSKRQIRINVYEPKGFDKSKTYPVHLNFHGSGFVLPAFFGTDADFCRLVSDRTGAIVLDGDYAKAPENPFPAATDDTKDILDHITANVGGYYDTSRITIGGFSAGGTLALTAGVSQPKGTIRGIVAIYPCADVGLEMAIRNPPAVSPGNKNPITPMFNRLVVECYTPPGTDLSDPRLSPINAPISTLPNDILMVVCEEDPLRFDAVQLAQKLKDGGINVVFKELKKMVHAWDKRAQVGTPQGDARKETYEAAVDLLNFVYSK